ncbi:unnamed protein product [Closterium sp. NIES-64]|nr:unnamed protein product [Closterium sp. NIES-64]
MMADLIPDLLSPSPAHPSSPSHSPLFSPLFSPALPSSPFRPSLIPPPLPPTSPPLTPHFSPDPLNFPTFCFPQAIHQLCFTLRSSPPSLSSLLLSPPLPCPSSTCLPALVLALCRGPGVVGQQPVLPPGASFEYTSVCPLDTRNGAMEADLRWWTLQQAFEVKIGAFDLEVYQDGL